jgi:hypothetical protein
MTGFMETVQEVWQQPVNTQDAILRMHVKLIRTAKALKLWRRQHLGNLPLRLAMVNELLLLMDRTQEYRVLTTEELEFRGYLKAKSIGLATIQRSRARQHSRLTWIRSGDACTKLFMLQAGNRKKKLFIPALTNASGHTVTGQQQKEEIVFEHFVRMMGTPQGRTRCLNWANLGYQNHDLSDLEAPFEVVEIEKTIKSIPGEKSPGPDGYIGLFYKKCWHIISADLTEAIQAFHSLRTRRLDLINEANIILLPKDDGAASINEFRPISLINSWQR